MSKASNLAGFVPSITPVNDLSVGVLTATSFSGNATGLAGTPNITVGFITATGASISGNVDVGGNVSIAGTLTYEDVTNVDSIGIVTARAGIVLGPTANTIQLGTGTTISSPSSNIFTVLTNGSERVRVDSSGRFLVGTSTNIGDAFAGATGVRSIQAVGPSASVGSHRNDNTAFSNAFIFTKARGTGSETVVDGDSLGIISWQGANGSAFNQAAEIRAVVDGVVSGGGTNDMPGRLVFSTTADGSASPTERARIDSSGRFGLGTSSPAGLLDLAGTKTVASDIGQLNIRDTASFASGVGGSLYFFGKYRGLGDYTPTGFINTKKDNSTDGNYSFSMGFGTIANGGSVSEKMILTSSGGLSVGTSANPGAGAIYATGDITAFYSSDIRLKKDIEPISEPIKKLMEISGVTYKWNEEYLKDKDVDGYFVRETEVGVIAQDVEKVLPEVVATRENGYKAVRYEKLVALLIEAVKDQQKQIDELKARLEEV